MLLCASGLMSEGDVGSVLSRLIWRQIFIFGCGTLPRHEPAKTNNFDPDRILPKSKQNIFTKIEFVVFVEFGYKLCKLCIVNYKLGGLMQSKLMLKVNK